MSDRYSRPSSEQALWPTLQSAVWPPGQSPSEAVPAQEGGDREIAPHPHLNLPLIQGGCSGPESPYGPDGHRRGYRVQHGQGQAGLQGWFWACRSSSWGSACWLWQSLDPLHALHQGEEIQRNSRHVLPACLIGEAIHGFAGEVAGREPAGISLIIRVCAGSLGFVLSLLAFQCHCGGRQANPPQNVFLHPAVVPGALSGLIPLGPQADPFVRVPHLPAETCVGATGSRRLVEAPGVRRLLFRQATCSATDRVV
ncbi:hypothetical protein SKAU_G00259450 [Synaphobranchus kaupii]|uniref:Uncharacterized protein n=1 Tax=Synaphobranchus kaupii TaxID=118154 RepID=A0A9Q1F4T3_SYNKA|nr:hypothetical protein SKAU_G00259450 [Synaphobranchus kaupii]